MSKHGGFNLKQSLSKKAKLDERVEQTSSHASSKQQSNAFLNQPCLPDHAITTFLQQARFESRKLVQKRNIKLPLSKHFCEIEARIGMLKHPYQDKTRISSSGVKRVNMNGKTMEAKAFLCNSQGSTNLGRVPFRGGITKSHYVHWTSSGLSEASALSAALGVLQQSEVKKQIREREYVETVFGGYSSQERVCFDGEYNENNPSGKKGKSEKKAKVFVMDMALPSAHYDLRLSLNTEDIVNPSIEAPPRGWLSKRIKRRRCYSRKEFAWQLDVTEVSLDGTQYSNASQDNENDEEDIAYEIEMELLPANTLQLINSSDEEGPKLCRQLAGQLWWMLQQINPLEDVLEVDSFLKEVSSDNLATKLAQAQAIALRKFLDNKEWNPAITPSQTPPNLPSRLQFMGCMPVNFSRHNIEQVQRSETGYFMSEKTDGVRHLLIFTGNNNCVLLDRTMKAFQPISHKPNQHPMHPINTFIQPGTVFDGEVVMHRKLRRPVFIVFDVLCVGNRPILQHNFAQRLQHLKNASFKIQNCPHDPFATDFLTNHSTALPLIKKNFVHRTQLDRLFSHIVEEQGKRVYKSGAEHCHCTDGIIFQPDAPYVAGTDTKLYKWKYLDTVTIDVEIMPTTNPDLFDWRLGVLGEEGTMVDMTRYITLPPTERMRLEADKMETKAKIAEVGFDPETGEWYYVTMRPDKTASNHISTVLGTLLELAESLGTMELRYRMNVRNTPSSGGGGGIKDTYRKEVRAMQKQLLDHQRKKNEMEMKNTVKK